MLTMLSGMLTLVRLVLLENEPSPIAVTARPLVVLGITTTPPGPVYPVMVIAPLLVVKVNWAWTTAGSIKSSSSASRWRDAAAVLERQITASQEGGGVLGQSRGVTGTGGHSKQLHKAFRPNC